jgi:hypothetical protein
MPADTLTPAQRRQSLAAIIGTAFGVGIAVGAIVPLVSLSLARDGYNALMIGINSAMLPIAVILMGPLMPRIIARLGTLRSVYFGLGITALCVLLFPVFQGNYYAWCAIRFVIGLAGAIHWITSETWINLMATSAAAAGSWHLRLGEGARFRAGAANHQSDGHRGLDTLRRCIGGTGGGADAGGLCATSAADRLRPRRRRRGARVLGSADRYDGGAGGGVRRCRTVHADHGL